MYDENHMPARVSSPGHVLRKELAARGWTQAQFAKIIGRPVPMVSEIVHGRKRITEETALEIGTALGTGSRFWLNMENTYRLWKLSKAKKPVKAIARRAKRATVAA